MKKKIISIPLTIILLVCLAVSACADYVGSVRSDIYHYSGCYCSKQIRSYNQIWFENAAQAKNYITKTEVLSDKNAGIQFKY